MASGSKIVEMACDGALEDIRKHSPENYAKLEANPDKKAIIIKAARATAIECVKLSEEFSGQPEDIAERLTKHLSPDRIKLILGGLSIPTFRLDVIKRGDGKHWAEFTRDSKPIAMFSSRALTATDDIDWSTIMQYASIVVEAVLLVLSAVGISLSPGESVIDATVKEVAQTMQSSSKFERAVEAFVEAWNKAGSGKYAKAKALFSLIKDTYSAGILWTIIKSLCKHMKWYEWLETAAKVSAMLIASLATDGVALIAEIALVVMSAVDFARKLVNVVKLGEIKKSL